jgi:hypothetical protein
MLNVFLFVTYGPGARSVYDKEKSKEKCVLETSFIMSSMLLANKLECLLRVSLAKKNRGIDGKCQCH